ncbi:TPA: hypothetical protein QDA94_000431 [Burkholderia vietnamiensis]|nr:hypothetical protein [Burkholderia vietnamiensis]HDR9230464.1 hypothetical protein [Burkholderia vietnamiensis]
MTTDNSRADALTDEQFEDRLLPLLIKHLDSKARHYLTREYVRDGIEVTRVTTYAMNLARAILAAFPVEQPEKSLAPEGGSEARGRWIQANCPTGDIIESPSPSNNREFPTSMSESDCEHRIVLAPSQPAAAPIDLQGLRRSILTPRKIVRDEDGMLSHPAIPYLDEDVNYETFFAAFGIEAAFIHMEGDVDCDTYDRYFASSSPDCSMWTPSTPQGDGWLLLEIYDTEDGPVALYVREKKPESMRERWKREKRESDAAAPSPADERAAMEAAWNKETGEQWFGGAGLTRTIWEAAWQAAIGWTEARAASANETGAEGADALAHEVWSAAQRAAFEWPLLPLLPETVITTADGEAVFTAHQMQGYANAYGEMVRAHASAANETGAEGAKTEAEIRKTMTPDQIRLERKLTCEAIDGAMALGYQNTNPPPSADHWLAPYWHVGRKQAELESRSPAMAAEAAAIVDETDAGLFVEILYGENGSSLKLGDKLYAAPQPAQAAMPALTNAMRAVITNESGTYQSADDLYAALCAAAGDERPAQADARVGLMDAVVDAAKAVVREALDSVSVHPCDEHDDEVRARQLPDYMQKLYRALLQGANHAE